MNKSATPFDVLPEKFTYDEVSPKAKHLPYVSYEKIVKSDASHAAWANFFNSVGASMATHEVTSQTTANGNVQVSGSGGSVNGTYEGTSTTTTTVPDYAARERAQENIEQRNVAISAEARRMSAASLKANTVFPGQTISGCVYFEFDKKAELLKLRLPINGIVYQFSSRVVPH